MNAERVCYLDSSAIVKLVVRERESAALRRYLQGRTLVSSALARVEVARAIKPHGTRALRKARDVLSRFDLVRINSKVLTRAAAMDPPDLCTLDAIHLATAALFGRSLRR
ncbi:MAG: type II toxin-antitoxin system VapC family toxin, partial [Spirochaetaceae bacterium]|nr:type II toxin-antitoxin system VapC family toxin [Spirochaetaceae bacterium]